MLQASRSELVQRTLHRAPLVYNGLGNPRRDGGVVVQEALGRRTIAAIGGAEELRTAFPDAGVRAEPFALSPAPVNAHTHLDLTAMPLLEGSYEEFISAVIEHGRSGQRSLDSAKAGADELLKAGTTVVGDIVSQEDVMHLLLGHERLQGVAYWEVLGPEPDDAETILNQTEARLRRFKQLEREGGMRLGLSPHTPHTVSAPLLRGLAALARQMKLPTQIHVAESEGEISFHRDGTGPLAKAMERWLPDDWQPSGLTPVAYLDRLGVLDSGPALVHGIQVSDEDIALVQRHSCTVVHCPRSNTALGCGRFPWERYARQGVTVALGSDSRGSSPSLAIEEEVFAALELHGDKAGAQALVRAAVKGGHRALGLTPPRFVRGDDASILHSWSDPAGK